MAIDILNRQRLVRIQKERMINLIDGALESVGKHGSDLTVLFVRDGAMRALNRKYRHADRPTDVLSFPIAEHGAASPGFDIGQLGDVVVSTDTALRQAQEARHPIEREIDELVIHGVLHLCGYDHETDNGEMNRLELKLRRKLLSK